MVHGCTVYTERAKTAAVSLDTSHVNNQTAMKVHHFGGMHYKKNKKRQSPI